MYSQFRLIHRKVYFMQCAKIETKLDRFFDKALSVNELAIIEKHLLVCTKCNNELSIIKGLKEAFNNDLVADIPAKVSEEIYSDVYNEIHSGINQEFKFLSWFFSVPQTVRISYVTVMLVALVTGFYISNDIWYSNQKPDEYSEAEIVEDVYKLEAFDGSADGLLYSMYVDLAMSPGESSLP